MTTRLRERRRGTTRTPGVLQHPVAGMRGERPLVQHGARRWGQINWRLLSGFIVLALSGLLVMFFVTDFFYVHTIGVSGLQTLTKEEVFALTGAADMHVFWLEAEEVRRNVMRSPAVADARVTVGWPPLMLVVDIQERRPAVVWQQSGVPVWVDVQGRVMSQREDRPDLLRIESVVNDGPLGPNTQLDVGLISGALQIKALKPEVTSLRYDPIRGLGYADPLGWSAWFGDGLYMSEKLDIYNTIVANLTARGIRPAEISVVDRHVWYYTTALGQ